MMNEVKEIESRIAELEKELAILKLADITKLDNCVVTLGSMTGNEPAKPANGDFIGVPFSAQIDELQKELKSEDRLALVDIPNGKVLSPDDAKAFDEYTRLGSVKDLESMSNRLQDLESMSNRLQELEKITKQYSRRTLTRVGGR